MPIRPEPSRIKPAGAGTPGPGPPPDKPYWRWSTSMPPLEFEMKMDEIPPGSLQPKKRSSAVVPSNLPSGTTPGMENPTTEHGARTQPGPLAENEMVPAPSVQTMPA